MKRLVLTLIVLFATIGAAKSQCDQTTINVPSAQVCEGSQMTYSVPSGMINYDWTYNTLPLAPGQPPSAQAIGGGDGYNFVTLQWNTLSGSLPGTPIQVQYTDPSTGNCVTGELMVLVVNVEPAPISPAQSTVCMTGPATVTYSTTTQQSNYNWTVYSGGAYTTPRNASSVGWKWTTPGTHLVEVSYDMNPSGCTTVGQKTVTVVDNNPLVISGPPSSCTNTQQPYTVANNSKEHYYWSIDGGRIISGQDTPSPTVIWDTPGTGTLSLQVEDQGCTSLSSSINVNVSGAAISGPDVSCVGTETYSTNAGQSGYSWIPSGGGVVTSGQGTNMVTVDWTTSGPQSISVVFTGVVGGCTLSSPLVKDVTIRALPTASVLGELQPCENGSYAYPYTAVIMTDPATTPLEGDVVWSLSSGGMNTTPLTNLVTNVIWTEPLAQSITLNYTDEFGCEASEFTYNVSVIDRPTATISGGGPICGPGSVPVSVALTGSAPWQLYLSDGSYIPNITSSPYNMDYDVTSSMTLRPIALFDSQSSCNALQNDLIGEASWTVNTVPTVTAQPIDPVCSGTSQVPLTFTTTGNPDQYKIIGLNQPAGWQTITGGPVTLNGVPTSPGTYTGSIVVRNSATLCESNPATITLVVKSLPSAPDVNSPVNYCIGDTPSQLTAVGTGLLWYPTPTGGTGNPVAPTPNTSVSGTTYHYVSQTDNNDCEGPRATIEVTVNTVPTVTPQPIDPVCSGTSQVELTFTTTGNPDQYKIIGLNQPAGWQTITGGPVTLDGVPTSPGTYTGSIVVRNSTTLCESNPATITLVVKSLPSAPGVDSPKNYCVGDPASPLTATGASLLWYTTPTGGTGNPVAPTPNTSVSGTTYHYVSQTDNGCEGPRATIEVNVYPVPQVTNSTSKTIYSGESTNITLTADVPGATFTWVVQNMNGTIGGVFVGQTGSSSYINHTLTNTSSSSGSVVYRVTPTAAICSGNYKEIEVTVLPCPGLPQAPTSFVSVVVDPFMRRIQALVSEVPFATSYEWYLNGVRYTGPGSTNSYVVMPISSSCNIAGYTVGVKAVNLCGTSPMFSQYFANPCYGGGGFFYAYPNPTSETLAIQQNDVYEDEGDVSKLDQPGKSYKLYDFRNQVVLEGFVSTRAELDVSRLKGGIYVLKIQISKGKVETHRIVID